MQNATIPCCFQELLPFPSVIYPSFHPFPPTTSLPSSLTSSCHLLLGLPLSLVVSKFIYNTFLGILFPSILCTCPNQCDPFNLIVSVIVGFFNHCINGIYIRFYSIWPKGEPEYFSWHSDQNAPWQSGIKFLARVRDSSHLQNIQAGSDGHLSSYPVGTGESFSTVIRPRDESDHSSSRSVGKAIPLQTWTGPEVPGG